MMINDHTVVMESGGRGVIEVVDLKTYEKKSIKHNYFDLIIANKSMKSLQVKMFFFKARNMICLI